MNKNEATKAILSLYEDTISKQYFILDRTQPITRQRDYRETWYTLHWNDADGIPDLGVCRVVIGSNITIYVNGERTEISEADLESILKGLI